MAEGDLKSEVNVCSEEQKSETNELCGRKIQWVSSTRPTKVAVVYPLPRNGNFDGRRRSASLSSPSPSSPTSFSPHSPFYHLFSPPPLRLRQTRTRTVTQPQPFSFDERDSMQRVVRERRLMELRQEEERQLMAARFRANPVRRYKPLVLMGSTRPLTVPRTPFSRQYE